jgi:hypothetical protein
MSYLPTKFVILLSVSQKVINLKTCPVHRRVSLIRKIALVLDPRQTQDIDRIPGIDAPVFDRDAWVFGGGALPYGFQLTNSQRDRLIRRMISEGGSRTFRFGDLTAATGGLQGLILPPWATWPTDNWPPVDWPGTQGQPTRSIMYPYGNADIKQFVTQAYQQNLATANDLPCNRYSDPKSSASLTLSTIGALRLLASPQLSRYLQTRNLSVITLPRQHYGVGMPYISHDQIRSALPPSQLEFTWETLPWGGFTLPEGGPLRLSPDRSAPGTTGVTDLLGTLPADARRRLQLEDELYDVTITDTGITTTPNLKNFAARFGHLPGIDIDYFNRQLASRSRGFGGSLPENAGVYFPFVMHGMINQDSGGCCPTCACRGAPAPSIRPIDCRVPQADGLKWKKKHDGCPASQAVSGTTTIPPSDAMQNWSKCKKKHDELVARGIHKPINCALILDGNSAPNAVAIVDERTRKSFCTGSMIDDENVLVAAHCLCGSMRADWVFVGERAWETDGSIRDSIAVLTQRNKDPNFCTTYQAWTKDRSKPYPDDDVAILQLTSSVKNRAIGNSVLPMPSFWNSEPPERVYVAGFGVADQTNHTGVKNIVDLKIENDGCEKSTNGERRCVAGRSIIAVAPEGNPGADSCFGDSGGPLMVVDKDGIHYLAGIVIRGTDDNKKNRCGRGGVYADLRDASLRRWIAENTKKQSLILSGGP